MIVEYFIENGYISKFKIDDIQLLNIIHNWGKWGQKHNMVGQKEDIYW